MYLLIAAGSRCRPPLVYAELLALGTAGYGTVGLMRDRGTAVCERHVPCAVLPALRVDLKMFARYC